MPTIRSSRASPVVPASTPTRTSFFSAPYVASLAASFVLTSRDWRNAMCPEVKRTTRFPDASRVRPSRTVMPPPTMSGPSAAAGRSQMPSHSAIGARENFRPAPGIASSAASRAAS